ncbi:probable flavin-containing monoamine oxidase A [Dendronephthya gigantea]|uniref:probable flavin-containing monoamine oxidase A n=1 Tax=Dendronephthya gigantea TaxID=151771 RepID=UPI00106B76C7|nr:probable flavin-containing monoamine oxidase A [Dendronephthya gigantea]
MNEIVYDVLVIGGGLSGLTAAYRLLQHNRSLKVLVLEAKDRIGGRTLSAKLKCENGKDMWDLGGQWVGSPQVHVMKLIEELGLEVHNQFNKGAKFARLSDGKIRKYSSALPMVSPFSLLDIYFFINKADKLSQETLLNSNLSKRLDSQTLENFKQNHCWTEGAKELFDSACGVIFGAHPSQISLLFFLHYCQCAGGVEPILESGKGSGQEWRIKGGAQTISHKLLEMIGDENVWLEEPVTEISQENDNETIDVVTRTGKKITSKYVVMAIPPHQALNISFTPNLPFDKEHLLRHMPVGHLIKFVVTYPKTFWRENGLSGEIVSFDDFKFSDKNVNGNSESTNEFDDISFVGEAPVSIVYDATSANGNAALVGFISGVAAARWTHKKEDEQIKGIIKFLTNFFGKEAENYLDFGIKDWSKEAWNGGCPVNYTTPGTLSIYGDCLKNPFGRIHWAGTETATLWSGFMNGAVQSGTRAANEVLTKIDPKFIPVYQDNEQPRQNIARKSGNNFLKFGILTAVSLIAIFIAMVWF